MLDEKYTGNGKVVLLAGGGKIYTDIAARFVRSERSLEEIVASPYSRQFISIFRPVPLKAIRPIWFSTDRYAITDNYEMKLRATTPTRGISPVWEKLTTLRKPS